jgi:sensor histidine kinase YesM
LTSLKKKIKQWVMQWYKFVFSNELRFWRQRHFLFWLAWWLYFWGSVYFLKQPYNKTSIPPSAYFNWSLADIIQSLCMSGTHIAACYCLIGFLIPRYLFKAKYLYFSAGLLLLAVLMIGVGYVITDIFFPVLDQLFDTGKVAPHINTLWTSFNTGLLSSLKVLSAAAAIKLVKHWWLKQTESEQLKREKINAELQLLKAQIHPAFLFQSLNTIYAYAVAGSPKTSEMLVKLSDLLSYMLYECDKPLVPLEKEIEMMKEYMLLEKIRHDDNLEMEMKVKGDASNKLIAPFLFFPFIENSFQQCTLPKEHSWMNMELRIEENDCSIKLLTGIAHDHVPETDFQKKNELINVQKRLYLLYPDRHELKFSTDGEVFLLQLKIQLDKEASQPAEEIEINLSTETSNSYASF